MSASTGDTIASGPLSGICQSVPRAELTAILAAVTWVQRHSVSAVIWSDALNIAAGLDLMLAGQPPLPTWEHQDLWQQMWLLVSGFEAGRLRVQHIPSHLDPELCSNSFEEWVAFWNDRADAAAALANAQRPPSTLSLLQQALTWHTRTAGQIRALRAVYDAIADLVWKPTFVQDAEDLPRDVEGAGMPPGLPRDVSLEDMLPVSWRSQVEVRTKGLSAELALSICEFVIDQDAASHQVFEVSWLELLAMYACNFGPLTRDGSRFRADDCFVAPLTVAEQLRLFRRAAKLLIRLLSLDDRLLYRVSRVDLAFGFPLDGIRVGLDTGLWFEGRTILQDFTAGRFCAKVSQLMRPFQKLRRQ